MGNLRFPLRLEANFDRLTMILGDLPIRVELINIHIQIKPSILFGV